MTPYHGPEEPREREIEGLSIGHNPLAEEHLLEERRLPPALRKIVAFIAAADELLEGIDQINPREAFKELTNVGGQHPEIKSLKEYAQCYEQIFEEIERLKSKFDGITEEHVHRLLQAIPERAVQEAFKRLVDRLDKETDYLKALREVGIAQALPLGLERGRYRPYVKFIDPAISRRARRRLESGDAAEYFPYRDRVHIYSPPPDIRQLWAKLASSGQFPEVVAHLHHELVHDAQTKVIQKIGLPVFLNIVLGLHLAFCTVGKYALSAGVLVTMPVLTHIFQRLLTNNKILGEIHAFDATVSSPSCPYSKNSDRRRYVLTTIFNNYSQNASEIPIIRKAYESIHTLRLLGFNDKEIGKLVSMTRFDMKKGGFPKLQEVIDRKRRELGLLDDKEFERFLRALEARDELEHIRARYQARNIAREELERLQRAWGLS